MSTTAYNLFHNQENNIKKRKLELCLTMHLEKVNSNVVGLNMPEENKYLKQNNGTWAEAVEQLDGTFIEFYKTKPPEPIFEMNERSMCWAQTNEDAKSTYDQLTLELLCNLNSKTSKGILFHLPKTKTSP